MSSVKNITKDPTPEVAGRLLKVANDVVLKYAQNDHWSTWRSWYAFRFGTTFADHPGAVSLIYAELCVELCLQEHELGGEYASTVELLCSTQAAGEERHHAIVALFFDSFAIIIDHALHPTAFRVPLGGVFEMYPYIPICGPESQKRFKYFLEDGKYKLTMDSKHASYKPIQFFGLDGDEEMTQPATIYGKNYNHENMNGVLPASKHLAFRSLLDEKLQLATMVQIRVDFADPRIVMQVHWADRPQSKKMLLLLMDPTAEGFRLSATDETVLLEQKLYAARGAEPKLELKGLAQLKLLGMEFGLSCEVFNDICWSVYRTWDPIRPEPVYTWESAHEEMYQILSGL